MATTSDMKQWFRAVGVMICFLACGHAQASHNRVDFDFESSDIAGWSPAKMSASLFGEGKYLGAFGANESVALGIMDALPAQLGTTGVDDNSSRRVALSFDMVNFSASTYYDLSVAANGNLVLNEKANPLNSTPVTATFQLDAEGSGFTDLLLAFYPAGEVSAQGWGIDNVVVDWSRPIPEPGTGLGVAIAVTLLLPGRRPGPPTAPAAIAKSC